MTSRPSPNLLRADVKLEMPPHPVWFDGRDAVTRFLAARAFSEPGDVAMVPTTANAQPAVADYRRGDDGVLAAHALHVLTAGDGGIAAITVFLEPELFAVFGSTADPASLMAYMYISTFGR